MYVALGSIGGGLGFSLQTSLSGMNDAALRMNVAANNIANANTNGFIPAQVSSSPSRGGGVASSVSTPALPNNTLENTLPSQTSMVEELVNFRVAQASYQANAKLISAERDAIDSLLHSI